MFGQRWLRFLPGRPQLLLFLMLAAVTVFAFGFIDLTFTRQALQTRYERAAIKVERLQEQNLQLQQGLDRAQQGQHLPDRAWQYYGQAPRGAGVIVLEPEPATAPAQDAARPATKDPFWVDLWRRLTRP